jgi:Transcriptional regulator PadR-like family
MTKTMTIEEAIDQLENPNRYLSVPEAIAFAAAHLEKGPVYFSGLMAAAPKGFALSDTIAKSALVSMEAAGLLTDYWEKVEERGRPRRMYKLVDGANVSPIAALNVCGGGV